MAVTTGDFAHCKSGQMAIDFTTTDVGGSKTATLITSAIAGDVFFPMSSLISSLRVQYAKTFVVNQHAEDSGYSCKFFLDNSLDDVSGDQTVFIEPSDSSDGTDKKIRILGYDTLGQPLQFEVNLDGTNQVSTGGTQFSDIHRVELRLISGALVNAIAPIQVVHGSTEVGFIPAGMNSSTAEVRIGMALDMDDDVTIADASEAPPSVAFFKPRILANALNSQNGGIIPAGEGQGIWWELSIKEGTKPSSYCQSGLMFFVEAA